MVAELWTAGTAARVTELQLGLEKRGCMLLIPKVTCKDMHPTPGCFGKTDCKLLKTNDRSRKKRSKRFQEAASS